MGVVASTAAVPTTAATPQTIAAVFIPSHPNVHDDKTPLLLLCNTERQVLVPKPKEGEK